MYLRMTDGRDRGEVKDFSFEDAQALLRNGQALAVDFSEADPLGKRSDFEVPAGRAHDAQTQINPEPIPAKADEPAVNATASFQKSNRFARKRT